MPTYEPHDQKFPNIINSLNHRHIKAILIITPIHDHYYKINFLRRDFESCHCPPYKEFICMKAILPNIICQFVTNLDREIKNRDLKAGYYESNFTILQERKRTINYIITMNKQSSPHNILHSLFSIAMSSQSPL